MNAPERYGRTKMTKIVSDFNALRIAIRSHDTFATEEAWERCERWIDIAMTDPVAVAADALARAEKAEAEHMETLSRLAGSVAKVAEQKALLKEAVEALEWAVDAWDTHNESGDGMQGDWVSDARATLAKIKEAQTDE